jgi:hypothetical protein
MKQLLSSAVLAAAVFAGCKCGGGIQAVHPQIQVSPLNIDWGDVAVNQPQSLPVKIFALTAAPLTISGMTLSDASQGGAAAYQVLSPPTTIPASGNQTVSIQFTPTAAISYAAILSVASDDPNTPITKVSLFGQGANPQIGLVPDCEPSNDCVGTATTNPAVIDFGMQPFQPLVQIPIQQLPTVEISNAGNVELTVRQMAIEGGDTTAFTVAQGTSFPDMLPDGGDALFLQPLTGRSISVRFQPTSRAQTSYASTLAVYSNDPVTPRATVALTGTLLPQQPPIVCANVVSVTPSGGVTTSYPWTGLVPAPDGGYDFSSSRDIPPRATIDLSALSDPTDAGACTTDPQDGRTGLTYAWSLLSQPQGSAAVIGGAATPTPSLAPVSTGSYTVQLSVTDQEGLNTTVPLTFLVAFRKDLVVELSWNQPDGGYPGVDLDVHLIRPSATDAGDPFSGAFSFFDPPSFTSGDLNGKSVFEQTQNASYNFAWGNGSLADTPSLDVDDTGSGSLVENISLDHPEDDPLCAATTCSYKVMVHYFQDHRVEGSPPQCTVGGACFDGDQCNCSDPTLACVANTADAGAPATGAGLCFVAPEPVVRIFVRSNPVPTAVIPLSGLVPPNVIDIGSPCEMWYAADVVWPSKPTVLDAGNGGDGGLPVQVVVQGADAGWIVVPAFSRFGERSPGSLACAPDIIDGSSITPNWYGPEPR